MFANNYVPEGDEDCLYLNVYTPLTNEIHNEKLPVMLYIHGGGWSCGDGNAKHYGPDYLLEENIVLVVINYRVGAFGFLSTEDSVAPGNYGLKDQLLALKWVQNNIKYFGGNSQKVTLIGQSAGAASVVYHLISPLSKGLFHGAIAQSGSAVASWALAKPGGMIKNTRKLAAYLNCPTNSNKDMVNCLKRADAYDIVNQERKFYVYNYEPIAPYMPTIEQTTEGAFITGHPMEIIKAGNITKVPFMTGITSEDGGFVAAALYNDSTLIERLNRDFNSILPSIFSYEDSASIISKSVRKYYYGNMHINNETKAETTKMYTDYYFLLPVDTTVRKLSKHLKQKVYYYLFGYRGSKSLSSVFGDPNYDYGVIHCDEFYYLFSRDYFSKYEPNESEKAMREVMVTLWTNFAKFGNPTPKKSSTLTAIWNPSTSEKGNYYDIRSHTNITMKTNLYEKRTLFWHNVWQKNRVKIEL